MTPALLLDLAMLWSLESVNADLRRDHDEASRLADEAQQIRDRALAMQPRAIRSVPPPCAA